MRLRIHIGRSSQKACWEFLKQEVAVGKRTLDGSCTPLKSEESVSPQTVYLWSTIYLINMSSIGVMDEALAPSVPSGRRNLFPLSYRASKVNERLKQPCKSAGSAAMIRSR